MTSGETEEQKLAKPPSLQPPIVLLEPDQAGSLEALVLALLPAAIRLAQRRAEAEQRACEPPPVDHAK